MTVDELASQNGISEYLASYGDDLDSVCNYLYGSCDESHIMILTTLNNRYDWTHINPGDTIYYLEDVSELTQVW